MVPFRNDVGDICVVGILQLLAPEKGFSTGTLNGAFDWKVWTTRHCSINPLRELGTGAYLSLKTELEAMDSKLVIILHDD